jgi:hypothetical protein
MNRRPLFFVVLLATWWVPLLLLSVAVAYEALQITQKPTVYVALGKIVVTPPLPLASLTPADVKEVNAEVYQTQIEILESRELGKRALERVRGLHPELKEIEVNIRATHHLDSSLVKVAALGREHKYTRVYLDALLDEYMAFREAVKAKGGNDPVSASIMERPVAAVAEEPVLTRPLVIAAGVGGGIGVALMLLTATAVGLIFGKPRPVPR